jgi:hypothetical protein
LSAAEIYGVADRLGSIEKGKIANLIVTDGELFQEKTRVKYVFIDGRKYEPLPEAPPEEGGRPNLPRRWCNEAIRTVLAGELGAGGAAHRDPQRQRSDRDQRPLPGLDPGAGRKDRGGGSQGDHSTGRPGHRRRAASM